MSPQPEEMLLHYRLVEQIGEVQDTVPEVREIRIVQDWFRDVEARLDAAGE